MKEKKNEKKKKKKKKNTHEFKPYYRGEHLVNEYLYYFILYINLFYKCIKVLLHFMKIVGFRS